MTTAANGMRRLKMSQASIIFVSEVGGRASILLVKMVVITSMMVRFTETSYNRRKVGHS